MLNFSCFCFFYVDVCLVEDVTALGSPQFKKSKNFQCAGFGEARIGTRASFAQQIVLCTKSDSNECQ